MRGLLVPIGTTLPGDTQHGRTLSLVGQRGSPPARKRCVGSGGGQPLLDECPNLELEVRVDRAVMSRQLDGAITWPLARET